MRVGFIGLGKLGLPCALAINFKGHNVYGYDISEDVCNNIRTKVITYKEEFAQSLMNTSKIDLMSIADVVDNSEIIFVPIQTPHSKEYEGITRLPKERKDFDYSYLKTGISLIADCITEDKVIVIISTVLPGTINREIKPLLNEHMKLCYNPFFIAMGTTIRDFLEPEFVLFGVDDDWAAEKAEEFYKTIHDRPFARMSIESAELTKVAYNTIITSKITIANLLMEICHKIPNADVDDVTNALKLATDRIVSPRYMDGGMGDGGGCHPRDNIALSWLAEELELSHNIYEDLMQAREDQTDWLATILEAHNMLFGLDIVILGESFKPETNITTGSPSVLLKNILLERNLKVDMYDPFTAGMPMNLKKAVYFIGTKHNAFLTVKFPEGSVVIDPFRYIEEQKGVIVIGIGNGNSSCIHG